MEPWKDNFLVADTQLYKRLCPSVRPSVRRSVRWSVRGDRVGEFDFFSFLRQTICLSKSFSLMGSKVKFDSERSGLLKIKDLHIGCVSTDDKNLDCSHKSRFQHEHRFMNFNCPTREWAKWVSEPVNGASEQSEHSEAECCGASERCKRTNEASDRVARSKRDCHESKQALRDKSVSEQSKES